MKKREIKEKVNNVFQNETPDFLSQIKSKCKSIPQIEKKEEIYEEKRCLSINMFFKKFSFCAIACIIFFIGMFIGNIDKGTISAKGASIYLDVNPSVEIQLDENNIVLDCNALNEDGKKILDDISLVGVNLNTAVYAIVGAMYTNGYLNVDTNSILVSVDSETINDLLTNIIDQINNLFKDNEEMNCSIIAQNVKKDEQLVNKALEYNTSIGKMNLIEKILNKSLYLTEENFDELVEMSIHELDLLYQSIDVKEEDDNEFISGKPGGFIENDKAYDYVLELLNIDKNGICYYDIVTLYHFDDKHDRKMIYVVTIQFINQTEKINYIIDCMNGELLSENVIDRWKDKIDKNDKFQDKENHDDKGHKDK